MKAVSRFGKALLAAALALGPWPALAQQAPASAPTTNTTAVDTIGPKALQNFSLNGTVTRAADAPTTAPARARAPRTQPQASPVTGEQPPTVARTSAAPKPSPARTASVTPTAGAKAASSPPPASPSSSLALPPMGSAAAAVPTAAPTFAADPVPAPTPERKFPLLPWLLAALALGAGGTFLFFRSRGREAFAGGPQVDAFVAPTPAPPRGAETPKLAAPASVGVVSTRLRPWIEIGFEPIRCVLDTEKVTVDFEIELFNSGSAPAHDVLVEASLFNAGPDQDQQIGAFFAKPDGGGDRIEIVPPMQRMTLRTQVFVPSDQVQAYELGGRPVFLPLIAFNALYKWSGGNGQTSASYLLGRDTKSDKLGPFRLDLGPRIFRGVGARLLPAGIRK